MLLDDLESAHREKRHAAVEHILRYHDVSHDGIKSVAEKYIAQEDKGEIVADALHLLGRLHAREQIPYLVSRLNYHFLEMYVSRLPTIERNFPAAGALIYIGLPSIRPVLKRLRSETDEDALIAGAGVLRFILGRRGALKRVTEEMKLVSSNERAVLTKVKDSLSNYFMLQ